MEYSFHIIRDTLNATHLANIHLYKVPPPLNLTSTYLQKLAGAFFAVVVSETF